MRFPGRNSPRRLYRRGLRLRAGPTALALAAPRDAPPEEARERGVVALEVVARGVPDRVAGARRAAGARFGGRAGVGRADGWVALLRLGAAEFAREGTEARSRGLGADRALGARSRMDIDRVTEFERDDVVGRRAALDRVEAAERPVARARDGCSGLTDVVGVLLVGLVAARLEDDVGRREVVARAGG